jgi:hypothetical protein
LSGANTTSHSLRDFQLRAELKNTRPLSVLMAEQVNELREWASARIEVSLHPSDTTLIRHELPYPHQNCNGFYLW